MPASSPALDSTWSFQSIKPKLPPLRYWLYLALSVAALVLSLVLKAHPAFVIVSIIAVCVSLYLIWKNWGSNGGGPGPGGPPGAAAAAAVCVTIETYRPAPAPSNGLGASSSPDFDNLWAHLLKMRASGDLTMKDAQGNNVLHLAILTRNAEIVRAIVDHLVKLEPSLLVDVNHAEHTPRHLLNILIGGRSEIHRILDGAEQAAGGIDAVRAAPGYLARSTRTRAAQLSSAGSVVQEEESREERVAMACY